MKTSDILKIIKDSNRLRNILRQNKPNKIDSESEYELDDRMCICDLLRDYRNDSISLCDLLDTLNH
mgnify:CR=1 FL=1